MAYFRKQEVLYLIKKITERIKSVKSIADTNASNITQTNSRLDTQSGKITNLDTRITETNKRINTLTETKSKVDFQNYYGSTFHVENLTITELVTSGTKTKVTLKNGSTTYSVMTTSDNVYLQSKDGTSQISQKELNDKLGSLIGKIGIYNSNPTSELNELRKFINIP